MRNEWWITGYYKPGGRGNFNWISFSYGPFFSQEDCNARADDDEAMIKALGQSVKNFEISCTDPLRYGQACKHFEETIKSEHFDIWYEKAFAIHREIVLNDGRETVFGVPKRDPLAIS